MDISLKIEDLRRGGLSCIEVNTVLRECGKFRPI
jgi:hypothetical protein